MVEARKRAAGLREVASAPEPPVAESEQSSRSLPRKLMLYGALALIAAGSATFGIQTVIFYMHHATTDDAQVEGHIDPVLPRVAGYVTEVRVRDNQRVAADAVLIRIDERDFKSRVNMAQAALVTAQAAVSVTRANAEAAHSRREKTSQDFARAEALRKQRVVSDQEYDAARAAADAAAAEYDAATRQVTAAEAQVAQRQADLEYAQLQLSYTTVTAPLAGVVAKKSVEVGQFVQAGQPLMAVVGEEDVWVVASFKETQLRKVRVGQPVEVEVDAYPNVPFHGRIDSIAPATGAKFSLLPPDNATGNFVKVVQRVPVKIILTDPPNPDHPLRVGMNVNAIVDLG